MKLQDARVGEVVHIRQRPAAFSFFPTYQGAKREGVHSTLFATDPWNIIRHNLEKITDVPAQRQALAFLVQARDFFVAAQNSDVSAAKPLLLYYAFLNLAKCLVTKRRGAVLGTVHHGLSEKLPTTANAIHGHVSIDISKSPGTSAFVMFAQALGAALPTPVAPNTHVQMRSQDFLGQVLIGHRVFCQAEGMIERFISLHRIDYMQDAAAKHVWTRVHAFADDFTRLGYAMTSLSKYLDDGMKWRNVKCDTEIDSRRIIEAETTTTMQYGHRPSQVIGQLSQKIRSRLWRSVTAYPPYRKYYLYQPSSSQIILDQLMTIYLSTFYFGSITRYKPEQFDYILKSPIGPFVFEFFSNQPTQFLYLMASEFMQQEVAKAAIT
ncbi:conserved hypothetical protein [Mesorhizobium plurifarium]|uniref:Uncharacterized protein n=1 Tax=Mesorhizobium plurifarium TaxID=69974 RepID=A0A090E9U8_MESPL|nr:conserved hypothetical protein [Mesorhizobium plurifarium]